MTPYGPQTSFRLTSNIRSVLIRPKTIPRRYWTNNKHTQNNCNIYIQMSPTPSVIVKVSRILVIKWEYKFSLRRKYYQEPQNGPEGQG